jgi:hypothetical protein
MLESGAGAVGAVDRIAEPVRVPVRPDTRQRWVQRIWAQEDPQLWIEVTGMEVYASVFGVRRRKTRLTSIVRQDDETTFS